MEQNPDRPRKGTVKSSAKPGGITERLDEVHGGEEGENGLDPVVARLQERSLPRDGGWSGDVYPDDERGGEG